MITTVLFNSLDIDECAEENVCANGECHNEDGTFSCRCNPGFEPNYDGTECVGKLSFILTD